MSLRLREFELRVLNMWTRMPFRYGIVTLTALPHLIVRGAFEVDGRIQHGFSADGLAPKWFTKDPERTVESEVAEMLEVVRSAGEQGVQAGKAASLFDFWRTLNAGQDRAARQRSWAPLLAQFGVSLIERAVIDAFCRAKGMPFVGALHSNAFGIRLGEVHPELEGTAPSDWLKAPLSSVRVRHTVGLADPLTEADISEEDRVRDGLPQSLVDCIRTYGLTHLKIKLPGDPEVALGRLRRIAAVLEQVEGKMAFTLDGNECFHEVGQLRNFWERLVADPSVADFFRAGLLFLEQPLHRASALKEEVGRELRAWREHPPIIIDESDGEIGSLPGALELGYSGSSHKNCKGVLKGIANACLIALRNRGSNAFIFSGEDLANVGPIALLQDLAVVSALGIEHVERNGHHYFAGLSAWPRTIQEKVLEKHPDLYRRHGDGESAFPTLRVEQGAINTGSLLAAPFGYSMEFDHAPFVKAEEWRYESLASPRAYRTR